MSEFHVEINKVTFGIFNFLFKCVFSEKSIAYSIVRIRCLEQSKKHFLHLFAEYIWDGVDFRTEKDMYKIRKKRTPQVLYFIASTSIYTNILYLQIKCVSYSYKSGLKYNVKENVYSFAAALHGHNYYRRFWNPEEKEKLTCTQKLNNPYDQLAH